MDHLDNEINAEIEDEEEQDNGFPSIHRDVVSINNVTNPNDEQNNRLAFQNYARMIRVNELNRNDSALVTRHASISRVRSETLERPQDYIFVSNIHHLNNDPVVENQNNDAAIVIEDDQNNDAAIAIENDRNDDEVVENNQNNDAVVDEDDQSSDVVVVEDNQSNDGVIIIEDNQSNDLVEISVRSSCETADLQLPPGTNKRKRSSQTPIKSPEACKDEQDDEGSICPICYDVWEMSGSHRLTSLKCGHLFGHSCIKRWLQQCGPSNKCCPSCKTRAQIRDLRFIYAKRIYAVDKSEEYKLRDLLDVERAKYTKLNTEHGLLKLELATTKNLLSKAQLELETERLKRITGYEGQDSSAYEGCRRRYAINYKLFLEKNIEICKESGCRVMTYGQQSKNLFVSQKSNQNLFPGYGVKYIDVETFRSTHFLHMSMKCIRDLSLTSSEDLMVSATQERSAKLFNIHDRTIINVFTPSDYPIWACSFDQDSHQYLYLGNATGTTFTYDIRQPTNYVREFRVDYDLTPVINICAVSSSESFPHGGVLICKLQSIWFNEYDVEQNFISTKLNVEGPFFSMSYDAKNNNVLISTRPKLNGLSKHILAKLFKIDNVTVLKTIVNFNGSKHLSVMSRGSQIVMNDTTLIAAYLQDVKLLSVWDSKKVSRIQSLPITDLVYDTCPIVNDNETYLAALTESKCRIYKVITDKSY